MPEYIRHDEGIFSSLTKQQKEAVGLLSVGTFLEYFDLMLYVHMAVLLNELFFPKADPHTQAIYAALAFCSTYVFRPFGALIFGWIGDTIGRKVTVIITTFMMSISCIIMANLPTYAQIGITATYIITLCRVIQGVSSLGEIVGAEIYLTEMTKPPVQYSGVALIGALSAVGGMSALGIASLVTLIELNWRVAFWIGAVVAIIGVIARTTLRETPEFSDAKKRLAGTFEKTNTNKEELKNNIIYNAKINKKTVLYLFFMDCTWPVCFYFLYFYCSNILKNTFGYSSEQIIHHNFIISIVHVLSTIVLVYLSYKIYPLKIVKFRFWGFLLSLPVLPYVLSYHVVTPFHLLLVQLFFILFRTDYSPATPIFYKCLPTFKRFTIISLSFALSRALMHIITSFGFIYIINYLGNWGLLIIMSPVAVGFIFGINYFNHLEQAIENHD